MLVMLRKVFLHSARRQTPSRVDSSDSGFPVLLHSSSGEFDRLPIDIFLHILKLIRPEDAARLSAVCKSLKYLVSDNRLWIFFLQNQPDPWDSICFSETHLRSGAPLQAYYSQVPPQLSFKQIYGQRDRVPGSIVVDGGSGYCKFGWSKYTSPSGRSATFLEFGNIESPMYSRLRHFFSTIYSRFLQHFTSVFPGFDLVHPVINVNQSTYFSFDH